MSTEKFVPSVTVAEAGDTATSAASADIAAMADTKKARARTALDARSPRLPRYLVSGERVTVPSSLATPA
jgi:hypothetical protein